MTIKNKKNSDIEALYKFQKGNIYKVKNIRKNPSTNKKNKSITLFGKLKKIKKKKPMIKEINIQLVGGQIYVPIDNSQNTTLDPI